MRTLRAFFHARRAWCVLLVAAALAMKALVPAGYMVEGGFNVLTISLCADATGEQLAHKVLVPTKPAAGSEAAGKGDCAFLGLTGAALPGAGPALLALALAFLVVLGFAPVPVPRLAAALRLRPPLRGPPAAA